MPTPVHSWYSCKLLGQMSARAGSPSIPTNESALSLNFTASNLALDLSHLNLVLYSLLTICASHCAALFSVLYTDLPSHVIFYTDCFLECFLVLSRLLIPVL